MRINISSRKSDLARIQALTVAEALKKAHPHLEITHNFRESLGDKNLTDPLWKMPERGVFTEDFLEDLINQKTDMVVHSWKDLPIEEREKTLIAATLPRADQRDLLLIKKANWNKIKTSKSLRVLTSSPRRTYNLEGFLKEALPSEINTVVFESVRGNVPTRIKKMLEQDVDGLVVAKAALDRLLLTQFKEFENVKKQISIDLKNCLVMIIPIERNPTAAAQGALAIEILRGRKDLEDLFKKIHCEKTFASVVRERKILGEYGGGCHQKVGVSIRALEYGDIIYTRAFTDKSGAVDKMEFVSRTKSKKATLDQMFPAEAAEAQWFSREVLNVKIPEGPLWISKNEALPQNAKISHDNLVWASGWETWKRLAKRGVWVTGCSESLGEAEFDEGLEFLSKKITWTKLTHENGSSENMNILGTYRLIPNEKVPPLEGKTHFYWMSGSSFNRALKIYPWIKDLNHSCGPGNTYAAISKIVPVTIFPTLILWKEHILK